MDFVRDSFFFLLKLKSKTWIVNFGNSGEEITKSTVSLQSCLRYDCSIIKKEVEYVRCDNDLFNWWCFVANALAFGWHADIYVHECCLRATGRCSLLLSSFCIADTKVKPSTTVPPELCLTMWSLCLMVQEQSGTPTWKKSKS